MEALYKRYLVILARLGALLPERAGLRCCPGWIVKKDDLSGGFARLDELATRLGNRYRSMGVLIGVMGVSIIFCAIGPVALGLGGHVREVLGVAKVSLMVAMLLVIWWGTCTRAKDRWIAARREAEMLRYADLHQAILAMNRTGNDLAGSEVVRGKLLQILDGESGQVAYNHRKAREYELIERFSNLAGWTGFVVALIAALIHFWVHEPWLLMFTGFLPALIGSIHGINGFLGIGSLAEEHAAMADRLGQLLEAVRVPEADENFLELAHLTYDTLTTRDVMWAEDAVKLGLRPA